MKKFGLLGIIAVIVVVGLLAFNSYNNLVEQDENVNNAWAKVESAYQRRADLIGNLVATVQQASKYEGSTLKDVVEARSNANSVKLSVDELNEGNIQKFQEAQESLNQSFLGRMNFLNENYPTLTATEQFRDLSAQIEGTENRIKIERDKFNETATIYNKSIRQFPTVLIAGFMGFDKKGLFKSSAGAEKATDVRSEFSK